MWPPGHLHGFEVDLNRLIDAYALQAHQEQCLSFKTFKRLFCFGSFAYLHQAYPGCEHNAEYTQMLFATVLERLDILSPTAPATSPLWALHAHQQQGHWQEQLPAMSAVHNKMRAAHSTPAPPAVPHVTAAPQGAASSHGSGHHEHHREQHQVQQQLQQQQQDKQQEQGQGQQQQQQQNAPLATNDAMIQQPCQPQQQFDAALPSFGAAQQEQQDPQQLPVTPGTTQDMWQQHQAQQQQLCPSQQLEQHQQPQNEAEADLFTMLFGPACPLSDPCLSPGQAGGAGTANTLSGEPCDIQLHSPDKLFGLDGGDDDDDEDGFLTDLLAILDEATAEPHAAAGPLEASVQAGEQGPVHQPPPAVTQVAVDAAVPNGDGPCMPTAFPVQQQQQLSQQGLMNCHTPVGQTSDSAAAPAAAVPAPPTAAAPSAPAPAAAAAAIPLQPPVVRVPIEVKAAVVFLLHCLYQTQLNLPKICVYTPLQLLRQLTAAAAEFKSAGPAAGDPLRVLHVMLQRQQLLVGQYRRPNNWIAHTPTWLVPDAVDPATAAREAAIKAAAGRASAKTQGGIRAAAVTAAVNAAKSLGMPSHSAVEPQAHREAMFHIKTALRGLSNFRALQQLCSEYAGARRAIFEPLLGLKEQQRQKRRADDSSSMGRTRSGPAAGRQKQKQQVAIEPPDLFDGQFGEALQKLANDEASRMLMLLDPCHNHHQVKKRLAEQQRAEREAAAAAERDAAAKLRHFRSWTQPDDVCKTSKKRSRDMVAVGKLQDVRDAGIFKPAELDELQNELAEQARPEMSGAARHVLQLQLHRRKRTLAVAEEWFTAHDSLMQQDAEDDDMP